jgi:hypothetical protein
METYAEVKRTIVQVTRSQDSWNAFKEELISNATDDIVKTDFRITYDELGHDMILEAQVTTTAPDCYLLQIFLQDVATGIWIPELQPFELSAVEFAPESKVTTALCGLVDSKWRADDSGAVYDALLWGYASQAGSPVQFGPFTKQFVYP